MPHPQAHIPLAELCLVPTGLLVSSLLELGTREVSSMQSESASWGRWDQEKAAYNVGCGTHFWK